jgi:flavin-dependent dehydrogenase
MVAVRRSIFDALLVQAAVDCGAVFSSNTTASVPVESADAERVVALRSSDGITRRVAAEVVICADGLSHPSLAHHAEFASRVRPASRVGLQTIIPGDVCLFPRGQLSMSIGREGYVGATFVGKDRLNIAAAVNPKYLTGGRRPWEAVGEILHQCRLPVPDALATAAWSGTPPLTRVSPTLSARRLFLIGDAAGYVEPFTGEGIAWALTSAESVVPIVVAACTHWSDSLSLQWRQVLKNKVTKNQWMCRILSRLLRRPQIAGLAVDLCRLLPPLRKMAISRVSGARRIKNPAGCIR